MWLLVVAGSLTAFLSILIAPIALANGHARLAAIIYKTFSHLCHQLPERSFFIDGHSFAACARCTGIYAGFAIAALLYPLVKSLKQTDAPARKWLFLAALPLLLDFLYEFVGLGHNTHTSRLLTGGLLGSVAVFYIMPGLLDLSLRHWKGVNAGPSDSGTKPAKVVTTTGGFPTVAAPSDYSSPHRRI
jgi:uncharacterized membrane protein